MNFSLTLKRAREAVERYLERRRWRRLLAYGQTRMRTRLKAEGLDLDRMTEDEVTDYVDRAIHEYRQERQTPPDTRSGKGVS